MRCPLTVPRVEGCFMSRRQPVSPADASLLWQWPPWQRAAKFSAALCMYIEVRATWWDDRPLWCMAAGVLGGSWLGLQRIPPVWLLMGAVLAFSLACLPGQRMPRLRRCSRIALLGAVLIAMHLCWRARPLPADHIAHHLLPRAHPMTVEGIVERPVEARGDRQHLYLRLQRRQIAREETWQSVSGLVRLNIHSTSLPLLPGDQVRVTRLRLYRVHSAGNPGGFDFQGMMENKGIYAIGGVSNPCRVQWVAPPAHWHLGRMVEQWRQTLRSRVQSWLEAPYNGLFLGMVLGQRSDIPENIQEDFRLAGIAHLLVVSGLNVGLVATAAFCCWLPLLRFVRSRLPRHWLVAWRPTPVVACLSMFLVLGYCTLVGWQVPTTRAAVMVGSYLGALCLERQRQALDALVFAALLLVFLDPGALYDVSFQLSFLAVAAILCASSARFIADPASPAMDSSSYGQRWLRWLREYCLVSIAAYLGTAPVLASTFHVLPVFGIVANLLIVPLAGMLVPGGSIAAVLLLCWPTAVAAATPLFQPLLAFLLTLTQTIAHLPGGQFHLASPSWLMILSYYGGLGSVLYRHRWRWVSVWAALFVLGSTWDYLAKYPRQLMVTFLEVGTGDAIVVQAPQKRTLVIDGGGTYDGRFDPGARIVAPFLWEHHVRRLDFMAMTHTHPNHARGLVSIMHSFPTQTLLTNGSAMHTDYLRALLRAAKRWGTIHTTALHGPRQWHWGQLQLNLLAPPAENDSHRAAWHADAENDRSLVLLLQYGAIRLLLTGDIEHATERWLVTHYPHLRADILQIPHHGSKTSTSPIFVQHLQPRDGIISVGAGNAYGHPHSRVLQTLQDHGVRVWRTDELGAITVSSDGTTYRIDSFRFPGFLPIQENNTE